MDCLFCKIIKGEIPSLSIYEDDIVKVVFDINPKSTGHCLVITKKHYQDAFDIDRETITYIYSNIVPKIYFLLKEKLNIEGLSIAQNNGLSQDIKHYHVHLIPNYSKKDIKKADEIISKF